jgi:hypothetical protein
MALKVTIPISNNINTSVVSRRTQNKVDTLADVDATGLQNGYTLIYNETTRKWEAVDPTTEVRIKNIDGGTY